MNTFFIIDKFNGAHKWTPQLLEKLPPYKFQTKFHAPDGRLSAFSLYSHSKQHGRRNETGKETFSIQTFTLKHVEITNRSGEKP